MILTEASVIAEGKKLLALSDHDRSAKLDNLRAYWRNEQATLWLPESIPSDVKHIAKMARVNMLPLAINSVVQSMYVDGLLGVGGETPDVWTTWRLNRLPSRQTAAHRVTAAYGAGYVVIEPGDPVATIRAVSPRNMTAVYSTDPDWPEAAIERVGEMTDGSFRFRIFDERRIWTISKPKPKDGEPENVQDWQIESIVVHGVGFTPVVRMLNEDDAEDGVYGELEPLLPLQDQINLTTFGLLVSQHYGAFRQRYILGMVADEESDRLKMSASRFLMLEDHPDDLKVGEFAQADLTGFIASREATIRHAAALSQTPAHELLGQLVNLSAEALAAAEASKARKLQERKELWGEAWMLSLHVAAELDGQRLPTSAQVLWRDTEPRSLVSVATALGVIATQLRVPVEQLWPLLPGVTAEQVEEWKRTGATEPQAPGEVPAIA